MSISVLVAIAGVMVAAVGTGLLGGQCIRSPAPSFIAWTAAMLAITVALLAQSIGFVSGFGPATFRAIQISAQLVAPVALAWGLVELVARGPAARFGARLAAGGLVVVAGVILATDPLAARPFGTTWPPAAVHYQLIPHYVLITLDLAVLVTAVAAVSLCAARRIQTDSQPGRRAFLSTLLGAAGAMSVTAFAPSAHAQQKVNSTPAPRDWSGNTPVQYPDPDVVALDRRFEPYIIGNTPMQRLYTGTFWSEGPAWNGVGRYLVWSDIPNNRQLRWTEEDSKVSVFRNPSNYSNGNTFDYEGRELSCEHAGRRVVRYEYDGTTTVIADHYMGKRFNSPNDIVVHPDGGIWFTDPTYGILGNYEAFKAPSEMKQAVYRVDGKTLQIDKVNDDADQPNGLCFTPDYKKLYVADTGNPQNVRIYDINGKTLRNGKDFVQLDIPGTTTKSAPDGIRCDVDGNLWCGCRPGVQIVTPGGERIGMIRLPETCANVSFGGQKRNHLFMASSQSLYAVFVGTQGAHIC